METIPNESREGVSKNECFDAPSTCKCPSHMSVVLSANLPARVPDSEECDDVVSGERLDPPPVFVSSCIPEDESLVGEPFCIAMYRSREDSSKVGAHTMADVAKNTVFGPWLSEEEEERRKRARASGAEEGDVTSSRWMRVSLSREGVLGFTEQSGRVRI